MQPHVDLKATGSRVPFVTARHSAHERLLARMGKLVCLQVTLGDELLVALVADEGSLTGVSSHMRLQVARFGELFEAQFKWTQEYLLFLFGPLNLLKLLCNKNVIQIVAVKLTKTVENEAARRIATETRLRDNLGMALQVEATICVF